MSESIKEGNALQVLSAEQRERAKQVLFNTEMVQAAMEDRKNVTRRVIKPQPTMECRHGETHEFIKDSEIGGAEKFTGFVCKKCGLGVCPPHCKYPVGTSWIRPSYRPGDILYVRETWAKLFSVDPDGYTHFDQEVYYYAADGTPDITMVDGDGFELDDQRIRWRPSIHMPKEAARLFLRVTNVWMERLQDITDDQARKEGCADRQDFARVWKDCYAKPRAVKGKDGSIDHYESYPWEDIQETRAYRGMPWYVIGNPWLSVIEFERIRVEEDEHGRIHRNQQ